MKKTLFAILLCSCAIFALTGCSNKNSEENINTTSTSTAKVNKSFRATITECEENAMIVKPDAEESISSSSDSIRVEFVDGFAACKVNDRVKVTYEGEVNESYPAQIGTTKIEIIEGKYDEVN